MMILAAAAAANVVTGLRALLVKEFLIEWCVVGLTLQRVSRLLQAMAVVEVVMMMVSH